MRSWAAALLVPVLAAAAGAARAQSCEQFRDRLAERIDASAKGMVLEIAPGSTTVPSGAKVVGTCEGGARKVLLFRSVSAAAAWAAAPAAAAASKAAPAKTAERAAPAASAVEAVKPPVVEPPVVARSEPPPSPAPAIVPAAPPAVSAVAPARTEESAAATAPAPMPLATRVADWFRLRWPWFAVPGGLLLAAALWAWIAYRRAYDDHGLPRGPRLRA